MITEIICAILWIAIAVAIIGVIFLFLPARDFEATWSTVFHRAWRRVVLWCGKVRLLNAFPWVTWERSDHEISIEEGMEAMRLLRAGDIGIHRDKGFLSNVAIPGFMKHAWIHVTGAKVFEPGIGDDYNIARCEIVEAMGEGVLRRSALYPIRSDYVIIVRPKNLTPDEQLHALTKANKIVGCRYDTDFNFDIEAEVNHFDRGMVTEEDKRELKRIVTNLRAEWDGGFTCTEVPAFSYWHVREKLGIKRHKARGKEVILADDYISPNFEIVWVSKSVTPDIARKLGLSEDKIALLDLYWATHRS